MKEKVKYGSKKLIAVIVALTTVFSVIPETAFASQTAQYHDPADHWKISNNRTMELDVNAHVTHETFHCHECGKVTNFTGYRVPEYTRDGKTALSRNVLYSDGTMTDGVTQGSILDGVLGEDAYYTGYHYSKSVCDYCGTINSNLEKEDYAYNRNVYRLYDCANEFMEDLDETVAIEYVDDTYHKVATKGGEYCVFCYGTNYHENSELVRHNMEKDIIPQIGHQRFAIVEHCSDCEYSKYDFAGAKAVIADYYGVVDGQPHTITVSDLSEAGVSTSIRYGNSAESCTMTSAPNYTEEGQYNVYYEITYRYKGVEMTENGVAKVWLRDDSDHLEGHECGCGCGMENCDCESGHCSCQNCQCSKGNHNYVFLDKINPACTELGYSRYFCTVCGKIEKRDYMNATGHAWQSIVIRDASCETKGKVMEICRNCGEVRVTETPEKEHSYRTYKVEPTCTNPGYTVKECTVCGDRHITDTVNAKPHNYKAAVIPATCDCGGKTIHKCDGCGSSFITDYTQPLGHSFDNGTVVTTATCDGSGVTEYRCIRCGYHYIEGADANGHKPGPAATCTEPQVCLTCGVILQVPTGHKISDWIIDKEPTTEEDGERHKECEYCHEIMERETIEKLHITAVTDNKGEAVVEGYLVRVTDTDTETPVAGATVVLNKNCTISIVLPDGRILDYVDQTTVTVRFVKDNSPVAEMFISVTDKNGNYSSGDTNEAGQITVPGESGKTNNNGNSTIGYEDPDGNKYTFTVRVIDFETGRPIEGALVTIGKTGNISVVLPDGTDMDKDNRITVIVTDNHKNPQEGVTVIVKNDIGSTAEGITDENGELTVPYVEVTEKHAAYIVGYPDGSFGPDLNMTRGEAAAIFARLLAEKKGDTIPAAAQTGFKDVKPGSWYAGYIKYLGEYGIVFGVSDTEFEPKRAITRAEFTAMAVRFFDAYGAGSTEVMEKYEGFTDLSSGYWAAEYIEEAALKGWIKGYEDGSFRASRNIDRDEAVTLMNRLLGRSADGSYISKNQSKLNNFNDLKKTHWAYLDIMEAANSHIAELGEKETWSK